MVSVNIAIREIAKLKLVSGMFVALILFVATMAHIVAQLIGVFVRLVWVIALMILIPVFADLTWDGIAKQTIIQIGVALRKLANHLEIVVLSPHRLLFLLIHP